MKPIKLSASTIRLFEECPRCFWVHLNHKKKRPSGPFPSLPGGMDNVIKKYFDRFRGTLPPELKEKIQGVLFEDLEKLNKWRNWRTGLTLFDEERNAILTGALDDLVVENSSYIPLDFKTRGYAVKENTTSFFQTQLNIYDLLLDSNGFRTPGFAYLVYYIPERVEEHGRVQFSVEAHRVETDREKAKKVFTEAVSCVMEPMPSQHEECVFCSWGEFEFAEELV